MKVERARRRERERERFNELATINNELEINKNEIWVLFPFRFANPFPKRLPTDGEPATLGMPEKIYFRIFLQFAFRIYYNVKSKIVLKIII